MGGALTPHRHPPRQVAAARAAKKASRPEPATPAPPPAPVPTAGRSTKTPEQAARIRELMGKPPKPAAATPAAKPSTTTSRARAGDGGGGGSGGGGGDGAQRTERVTSLRKTKDGVTVDMASFGRLSSPADSVSRNSSLSGRTTPPPGSGPSARDELARRKKTVEADKYVILLYAGLRIIKFHTIYQFLC